MKNKCKGGVGSEDVVMDDDANNAQTQPGKGKRFLRINFQAKTLNDFWSLGEAPQGDSPQEPIAKQTRHGQAVPPTPAEATPAPKIPTPTPPPAEILSQKLFEGASDRISKIGIHAETKDMRTYAFFWDTHFSYMKYNGYNKSYLHYGHPFQTQKNIRQYDISAAWTKWNNANGSEVNNGETIHLLPIPSISPFAGNEFQPITSPECPYINNIKGAAKDIPVALRNLTYHQVLKNHINSPNLRLIRQHAEVTENRDINAAMLKLKGINKQVNDILLSLKDDAEYSSITPAFDVHPFLYNSHECKSYKITAKGKKKASLPEKYKCVCYLCGATIANTSIKQFYQINGELDHIIPKVIAIGLGVHNTPLNYAFTHDSCNSSKSNNVFHVVDPNVPMDKVFDIIQKKAAVGGSPVNAKQAHIPIGKHKSFPISERDYHQAAKSAKFFEAKAKTLQRHRENLTVNDHLRLLFYRWLANYFKIIQNGLKNRGGALDCITHDEALRPYVNFLTKFEPYLGPKANRECYTSCVERAQFFKSRYENLFKFSRLYIKQWGTTLGKPIHMHESDDDYSIRISERFDRIIDFINPPKDGTRTPAASILLILM